MNQTNSIQRAEALALKIRHLGSFAVIAREEDALRTRLRQLEEKAIILGGLAWIRSEFARLGLEVQLPSFPIAEARRTTQKRRDDFAANPANLGDDPQDSSFRYQYLQGLDEIIRSTKSQLLEFWQADLKRRAPELQDELLSVLANIAELRGPVRQIQELARQLAQHAGKLPQDEGEVASAHTIANSLTERWREFEGIESDILDFLRAAVSPAGATLADLEGAPSAWLRENKLLGSLRLSFRTGPT